MQPAAVVAAGACGTGVNVGAVDSRTGRPAASTFSTRKAAIQASPRRVDLQPVAGRVAAQRLDGLLRGAEPTTA